VALAARPTLPRGVRPVRWRAERIRAAGAPALGLAGGSLVLLDLLREIERRKIEGVTLISGPHLHVASMSAKPPCKIAGWPNVNGFDS